MASQALISQHRDQLLRLQSLVERDLNAFWRTLDVTRPVSVAEALEAHVRELTLVYGDMAAALAAAWYEEVRDAAGAAGYFSARLAEADQAKAGVVARWSASSLFGESPAPEVALSRLVAGTQRIVHRASTETVEENMSQDRAATGRFYRDARADGCAFCLLVASRGPVYRSRESAGDGRRFHDHCYCVVVPDFGDYEEPAKVSRFLEQYEKAREKAGSSNARDILSALRTVTGAA